MDRGARNLRARHHGPGQLRFGDDLAFNRLARAFHSEGTVAMTNKSGFAVRTLASAALIATALLTPAAAQEPFRIGLIIPMTGGQASTGKQLDNAVKLYIRQHGDTVAGRKIEVLLKDDGANPDNP